MSGVCKQKVANQLEVVQMRVTIYLYLYNSHRW